MISFFLPLNFQYSFYQDDKLTWKEELIHGEWIPGSTAGGCGQPNKGLVIDFSINN